MSDRKLPPSQPTLTQMSRSSVKARQMGESDLNSCRKFNEHNIRLRDIESRSRTRIFKENYTSEKCTIDSGGYAGGYDEMESSDSGSETKFKRMKKRSKRSDSDNSKGGEDNTSPCLLGISHPVTDLTKWSGPGKYGAGDCWSSSSEEAMKNGPTTRELFGSKKKEPSQVNEYIEKHTVRRDYIDITKTPKEWMARYNRLLNRCEEMEKKYIHKSKMARYYKQKLDMIHLDSEV